MKLTEFKKIFHFLPVISVSTIKKTFTRILISTIYGGFFGGLIGCGFAYTIGDIAWIKVGIAASAISISWAWALSGVGILAGAWTFIFTRSESGATGSVVCICAWAMSMIVIKLAKRRGTTTKSIMDNHIDWLFSFPIQFVHFLSPFRSFAKTHNQSQSNHSFVNLIVFFTQELSEVFPEEWDEWQHWINDMMELRTRMLAKGMNHRLVSLITFYRLFRFVLHIGIDKVFILATRRATR